MVLLGHQLHLYVRVVVRSPFTPCVCGAIVALFTPMCTSCCDDTIYTVHMWCYWVTSLHPCVRVVVMTPFTPCICGVIGHHLHLCVRVVVRTPFTPCICGVVGHHLHLCVCCWSLFNRVHVCLLCYQPKSSSENSPHKCVAFYIYKRATF